MTNFRIEFDNPWLLLLLIPAVIFTLLPYFLSNKKYRRNRNRITSIVLHLTALVLSITVLAGITFNYDVPNRENEVILLVDKSDSNENSYQLKEDFIANVLDLVSSEFKVGVVTFGYNQVYAAPLSENSSEVYLNYARAELPDGSASDISAALTYTATLFSKPESARIVLLSDGVETDGNVKEVINKIAKNDGIKVDTVNFPNELENDAMILSVAYQDAAIRKGEKFEMTVSIQSSFEGTANLTVYDNATLIGQPITVRLIKGVQEITLDATLQQDGLHNLNFMLSDLDDAESKNDSYNSYLFLESFNNVLIIESISDESALLKSKLPSKNITVINAYDTEKMPKSAEELRSFDEIILFNVSNADLPKGFDQCLYEYVRDIGGGLFTVCGNKDDGNPNDKLFTSNAYNYDDMYGTLYQELLPVDIIEYEPPVAVVIIIDTSGSMYDPTKQTYERSKLKAAIESVESILNMNVVNERDYVGIMTFSDFYDEGLALTPVADRDKILGALDDLAKGGGSTIFTAALERAGTALNALDDVDKKHIILITDGAPTDSETDIGAAIKRNKDADTPITMSIVGIEAGKSEADYMRRLLTKYGGMSEENYHDATSSDVGTKLRADLAAPYIKDVQYGAFRPTIEGFTSITAGLNDAQIPMLYGFYGSKLKPGAQVILDGEFVPIYAQWKFGKGSVGSFMCDLNGTWSQEFLESDIGVQLINNMLSALSPTESIHPPTIRVSLKEENYYNTLNVFADAKEGDSVKVEVIPSFHTGTTLTFPLSLSDTFEKITFPITEPGVYEIKVTKTTQDGATVTHSIYKAFSYSQEYNPFTDPEEAAALLAKISELGNGFVIEEPEEVFANAVKFLPREINPRILFIIIALVAFVLDIAARKFKFKWPHELIRESKKAKKH